MKKILVLMLAMLIMSSGMAYAAEWQNGLSPSQPYEGLPAVDLETEFGYQMVLPRGELGAEMACDKLYIFLPRDDVKAGSGKIYLCNEKSGVIWSAAMNESESVEQKAMTEFQLESLLWGSGTCFEITLPKSLELGKTYFVNMELGCIVTENGIESPEVGGTDSWAFEVEGEYGVNQKEYRRPKGDGSYEEGIVKPKAGDELRFDLVLSEETVVAMLYGDDTVSFEETIFEESGEIIGTVEAENPIWGVIFLDEEGNVLNQIQFSE